MISVLEESTERFIRDSILPIEGWINPDAAFVIALCLQYQLEVGETGDIIEIGVWQGKLLSLLYKYINRDEKAYGVDCFVGLSLEQAHHRSGVVSKNIASACGDASRLHMIAMRSDQVSPGYFVNKFKVASIDGGNDFASRSFDLRLCARNLSTNGFIILNGVFNRFNPDSTEALFAFLHSPEGADFSVVADCNNKTIIVRKVAHAGFYNFLRQRIDSKSRALYARTSDKLEGFGTYYRPHIASFPIIPFA